MSGSIISSGIYTENNDNIPEIERIMNLKIMDLSIQIIPLKINKHINRLRMVGQFFQQIIYPKILSPTLSHIAIQLNMENDKDIVILEYGQYLTENSDIDENNLFSSCDSCSNSYKDVTKFDNNKNIYWYINKDGLRMTKIAQNKNKKSKIVSKIIACNHYGISHDEFKKINSKFYFSSLFECIDCDINNKITLNDLCNNFKEDNWDAKHYNVITHNCQHFAAQIIKVLKAIRKNEEYKIRSIEKFILPNCIISALWDNEKLSLTNTMGRIPIIGIFYDLYKLSKTIFNDN